MGGIFMKKIVKQSGGSGILSGVSHPMEAALGRRSRPRALLQPRLTVQSPEYASWGSPSREKTDLKTVLRPTSHYWFLSFFLSFHFIMKIFEHTYKGRKNNIMNTHVDPAPSFNDCQLVANLVLSIPPSRLF